MGKIDALLKYYKAEQELKTIENEVKTTPMRVRFNKIRKFLTEQQSAIQRMQTDINTRAAELEKLVQHFNEMEQQYELEISEVSSMENDADCTAEEVEESRRELESLLSKINGTKRDVQDLLQWLDKIKKDYQETYTKAGRAKKEYDSLRSVCEEELQSYAPKLDEAKAAVLAEQKNIAPNVLEKYKRVKKNHAVPIAKIENNQCGGCNMSLPTVVIRRLNTTEDLVECENCGRILYIEN